MAALPTPLSDADRHNSSSSHGGHSHGRGGAGNIGHSAADDEPVDLQTPTLKGDHYTTGRGGLGNIAENTDPEEARRAQDVVSNPPRELTSDAHVGRGGAANVLKPTRTETETEMETETGSAAQEGNREAASIGLADKAKAWLFRRGEKA